MLKLLFLSILLLSSSFGFAQTNTKASPVRLALQLIDQPDYEEVVSSLTYYGFELLSGDGTTASFQYPDGTFVTYSVADLKSDPEVTVSTTAKHAEIEKILSSSGFTKVKSPSSSSMLSPTSENEKRKTDNVKPTTIYEKGTRLHSKSTVCSIFKGSPTTLSFYKRSNQ